MSPFDLDQPIVERPGRQDYRRHPVADFEDAASELGHGYASETHHEIETYSDRRHH